MAYQKLQTGGALKVHPSATVMIPDPSTKVLSGTTTATTANKLVDGGATFASAGIQKNAIVYNTTDTTAAYVTAIDSDTTLSLSVDIIATGENYVIYNRESNGCVLYVGTAGNVTVQMASDKDLKPSDNPEITYLNVANASFMPIQVVRVDNSTTATDIIALW